MSKILSVSVAAYNVEEYLAKCLDSFCVPEIMDDIEVLIINNGSTDRTSEIAREYVARYPQTFILINKENEGYGSTYNVAIKAATGKYFKIVDADDWVEKEGIINLVKTAAECSADAILTPCRIFMVTDKPLKDSDIFHKGVDRSAYLNHETDIDIIADLCDFNAHTVAFKTNVLKSHFTPITENCYYVDVEYDVFYFAYVSNAFILDGPVYVYRLGNPSQSVAPENSVKRRDQHYKVLKRTAAFYADVAASIPDANRKIILKRVSVVFNDQILLRLSVDDIQQSLEEMRSLTAYFKSTFPSVYDSIVTYGKQARLLPISLSLFLEKNHYRLYGLIYRMFHVAKRMVNALRN